MTRSQVQSCGYGFADTFVCEVFSGVFPAVQCFWGSNILYLHNLF